MIGSSVRVEFLLGTDSTVRSRSDAELNDAVVICHAIRMDLLAGARDERHLVLLCRLLVRASVLPTELAHCDEAAALFRRCRRRGETVRWLIAAVPVLRCYGDFDILVRHTELDIAE